MHGNIKARQRMIAQYAVAGAHGGLVVGTDQRGGRAQRVPDRAHPALGEADEDALGVTYEEIDDFLEGKPVTEQVFETIVTRYRQTDHKRRLPIAP